MPWWDRYDFPLEGRRDQPSGREEIIFEYKKHAHYYGNLVRKFFFSAALLMLVILPVFRDRIPMPLFLSILAITVVGFFAGMTNPLQPWVFRSDLLISLIGFVSIEYFTVSIEGSRGIITDPFFFFNQVLAILFFFAFYFSTKTWRGFFTKNLDERRDQQSPKK